MVTRSDIERAAFSPTLGAGEGVFGDEALSEQFRESFEHIQARIADPNERPVYEKDEQRGIIDTEHVTPEEYADRCGQNTVKNGAGLPTVRLGGWVQGAENVRALRAKKAAGRYAGFYRELPHLLGSALDCVDGAEAVATDLRFEADEMDGPTVVRHRMQRMVAAVLDKDDPLHRPYTRFYRFAVDREPDTERREQFRTVLLEAIRTEDPFALNHLAQLILAHELKRVSYRYRQSLRFSSWGMNHFHEGTDVRVKDMTKDAFSELAEARLAPDKDPEAEYEPAPTEADGTGSVLARNGGELPDPVTKQTVLHGLAKVRAENAHVLTGQGNTPLKERVPQIAAIGNYWRRGLRWVRKVTPHLRSMRAAWQRYNSHD